MRKLNVTRRDFLKSASSVAAFSIVPIHVLAGKGYAAPSDKLRIAHIGAGGRAGAQLGGCRSEYIVALCDVDDRRAADGFKQFPDARKFKDFRKMLDAVENDIDAVTVSTPDHTHAVAVMNAIKRGKHVYCEKPLAHSIYEIRELVKAANKHKVITQLGNQGHSFDHIRVFCEWIWDGAIGEVTEVHARCGSNYSRISSLSKMSEKHDIPAGLDWDLWQGPVKERGYNPMYLPGSWRGWGAYGCGVIGDWVCHVVDPVFWALDLGAPVSVQATAKDYHPVKHAETFPAGMMVKYDFPAKGKRGPVTLMWLDGNREIPRPDDLEPGRKVPGTGAVVLGTKGKIMYGSHGASGCRIIPETKMKAYKTPEPSIKRVKSHHADWLDSIKNGKQAGSNFNYGGPLTELAHLGIIAMRHLGEKLMWDSENMQFTNNADANKYIKPEFRSGWEL